MYHVKGKDYPCCTSVTMGIVGGKWKTVILFHLMEHKKLRYSELRKKMGNVTERALSLQLKQLQQDGVINRKVFTTKAPLRVEYSLSGFGETLRPLLKAMVDWGEFVIENYSD